MRSLQHAQQQLTPRSSLHAFFAPRSQSGKDASDAVDLTGSPPPAKRAKLDSPQSAGRTTEEAKPATSRFFKSPSGAGSSSTGLPRAKPHRNVALESFRASGIGRAPDAAPGSAFEAFSLPSTNGSQSASQTTQRSEEQEARHKAWQRVVNGPGGVMPRRRSLALDEAAAAEVRKATGVVEDVTMDDEGGKEEEENVASTLRSKYAAKEKPKRGRGKKVEEVGPSGQTYTPLEKQYMEIKDKWPDVLLLMEGK